MKEDFIQNIHFDLFSVELVIGETATLLLAESYVTIREVFVDGAKVEPNEEKQIFLQSGGDDLWELSGGDILRPKDGKTFTIKKAYEVNTETGNPDKYLNEQGDMAQVEAGQVKYTPSTFVESENVQDAITELGNCKQVMLVSGANIKTINGESILGSGNIEIQGGGSTEHNDTLNKNVNPEFLHATQAQHDRWTNNYSYKIEDTSVSTWADSTAYAGYGFQAQINIADLSESDFVNVVFGVNDANSGNYAAAIEQYEGYILVFSKVNTAITIPTIEITKIDL